MTADRPRVSVAMTTYNGAAHLAEQLASIAAQSVEPDEIIIGDDGSTDRTPEIVERFTATTSIPVAFWPNARRLGSTGNFVETLTRCTGDLVVFSDQDDVWNVDRIEQTVRAFHDRPACDLVFSDGALIDANGHLIPGSLWQRAMVTRADLDAFAAGRSAMALLRRNVVTGATMAVRRRAALDALPVPDGWVHDAWWALTLGIDRPVVPIAASLIRYRVHPHQQLGLASATPAGVWHALRRHDADFYRAEARNMRSLGAFLGEDHGALPMILRKARFLDRRADFRLHPLAQVPGLARSFARGEYTTLGMGGRQFLLDLAAPFASKLRRSTRAPRAAA